MPDAASLKAGRGLATARKWELLGGDDEALWGLAVGSGKNPYQTRVWLADLATKCSCPSRKFPCKHAIALMLIAAGDAGSLTGKERPDWLTEWLDSRAERSEKAAAKVKDKPAKPVDDKAAAKRREKKEERLADGVELLRTNLLDMAREGLASSTVRDRSTWESLQRRMVDCQAPGLASALRHVGDRLLHHPEVDTLLAWELGRLYLLTECHAKRDPLDEPTAAEIAELLGAGPTAEEVRALPTVEDRWFVAGRNVSERDRLLISVSWLLGTTTGRWAKVLRFAHLPATLAEPWPLGSTVEVGLSYHPGLLPMRVQPAAEGHATFEESPPISDDGFESLLKRYAEGLAANPFLQALPFLIEVRPDRSGQLADRMERALPWSAGEGDVLRVEAITGGVTALACGEWDGHALRLLAIDDGGTWFNLVPLHS